MPRNARKKEDVKQERKGKVNIESKGTVTVINRGQEKVKRKPPVKPPVKSPVKQQTKPVKNPGGRGLGKAGARRLGQLLKRAIQEKKNVTGNEKVPLPTTPVRLFKYQAEAASAPKTNDARRVATRVSQLILRVVSQCKHRGGISMVDLKHALAAGGYDVTKNNTRVNLAVKGLVRKETLVQTTGVGASGSFKLNKKLTYEKRVKTRAMRDLAAAERAKQKKGILKPAAEKGKALKPTGKGQKPGAKTTKPAGKALKPGAKTTKPAGKTAQPADKNKTVVGKGQREIGDRPKQVGKSHKPAGQASKSPAKVQKTGYKAPKPAGKSLKAANKKTRKMVVTRNTKPRI
ncbi:histone H1-like isoform X1 [Oncorhynchus tshawytscha]|uniref:H15 domain-containing protein n=1 Tax=Oncorhynchus tshawytscha TaxID=74940 RepID=A0AAZ3P701_ONCTS|nr:histone H1-like isoform X1 [Oncorhynchus tshawytscha]